MEDGGVPAGNSNDGVEVIARSICERLDANSKLVWMDDDGLVFVGDRSAASGLPGHWIVGTYHAGHTLVEIAQDLEAMAIDRENELDRELEDGGSHGHS